MARAHFFQFLAGRISDSISLTPLAGATVNLYQEGTSTPITETIYSASSGVGTLTNPLTAAADGSIDFYLEREKRIDLLVSLTGFTTKRITVDVGEPELGHIDVADFGVVADGSTDNRVALDAAIAAWALTGGDLIFPPGTIKVLGSLSTIPNDGATPPRQRAGRWIGAGADQRGGTSAANPYGGTILQFDSPAGIGCIDTRGDGTLEITGIMFWQNGTAHQIPYIHTTNTTLQIHHCGFLGHSTKATTTCDQDAIILGGTTANIDGSSTSSFFGFGTVIQNNWFNRIKRIAYFRVTANGIVIRDNSVWTRCGGEACIEIDGGVSTCTGNVIQHNLIEMVGYTYFLKATKCIANTLGPNNLFDAAAPTTAYYRMEATADYNWIIAGWQSDAKTFVSDAGAGNTKLTAGQSQISIYPQPIVFSYVGADGVKFDGPVKFRGGNNLVSIQPAANQVEGQKLIEIVRSTSDDVNPGGEIFSITQAGTIQVTDSVGATVQFSNGMKTWAAGGSGGAMAINSGNGNLTFTAAGILFNYFSGGAELVRMRVDPTLGNRGTIQLNGTSGVLIFSSTASPEGVFTAPVGSICLNKAGTSGATFYVKETGTSGNTGWVAK